MGKKKKNKGHSTYTNSNMNMNSNMHMMHMNMNTNMNTNVNRNRYMNMNINMNMNMNMHPKLRGMARGERGKGAKMYMQNYPHGQYGNNHQNQYYDGQNARDAREFYNRLAVEQIEYYFTVDNLSRDVYLRSKMDVEGFVPIQLVASFPAVRNLNVHFHTLRMLLAASPQVEVDLENNVIRARDNWKLWLLPAAPGSSVFGLPRYRTNRNNVDASGQTSIPPPPPSEKNPSV